MTKKIAVTGGIGSGKSVALAYIRTLGYPTYSCDEIYKEVILSNVYTQQIKALFPSVVDKDGINRKKLSAIVFQDEAKRQALNAIAHPMIMEKLLKEMEGEKGRLVFAEVPLLFEGNYEKFFDEIIVIKRDAEKRISGVRLRDGISENEILARINAQLDYESETANEKLKKNNVHILKNNRDISDFERGLNLLISSFLCE